MSDGTICKECGFENPTGSKFCSNCGAKLPLSTHILCPNCSTPNTRDRVFCDHCGTRLIPEETHQHKEQEEPEEPAGGSKAFTLPSRRPGDTGELDPGTVPDWLRTGETEGNKLPSLEELTPGERESSDLPEWLVHDSDPDPIINAPTTISTEFYQDLVGKADDLPEPDDLLKEAAEANLPDWLAEESTTPPAAESEPVDEVTDGDEDDMADWFDDLAPDSDELDPEELSGSGLTEWLEQDAPESEMTSAGDAGDDSGSLTDWLSDLSDLREEFPDEFESVADSQTVAETDESDWMAELGPMQTGVLADDSDEQADENLFIDDDTPDWMDELGPLQTDVLAEAEADLFASEEDESKSPPAEELPGAEELPEEWLQEDDEFASMFDTSAAEDQALPEWLADDETGGTDSLLMALDEEEPALDEMFAAEEQAAESEIDWLMQTGSLPTIDIEELSLLGDEAVQAAAPEEAAPEEAAPEEAAPEEAALEETAPPESVEEVPSTPDLDLVVEGEDLDWLADLEAVETGELLVDMPEEFDESEAATAESAMDSDLGDETLEEVVPEAPAADEEEYDAEEEDVLPDELPDWIAKLSEASELDLDEEEAFTPSHDMPEWVASMRPGEGHIGSELPDALMPSIDELPDDLEGIPTELAGADLPDWLQDVPVAGSTPVMSSPTETGDRQEVPDWLQPEEGQGREEEGISTPTADFLEPSSTISNEWSAIFNDLPPVEPLAETLPKAEIPEWVQDLKPPELTGKVRQEPEEPEQTIGPLSGLRGVIEIEPVIALPRTAAPTLQFTVPHEHQQQVTLLQHLIHEEEEPGTAVVSKPKQTTSAGIRILLAVVLIAAILVGLQGRSFVKIPDTVPPQIQAVQTAVSQAAGAPVLVAFEYTPALAGELTPQAETLLAQLDENGSPIILVSQYTAGTAISADVSSQYDVENIGYLAGDAIGLRQLGDCIETACEQLIGQVLAPDIQADLPDVSLIVVLTGDRESLINWIEQVGSNSNVPILAGITQSLAPAAAPYLATEQLEGALVGMADTAVYQQFYSSTTSNSEVRKQLNAQITAQLLVAIFLFIGALTYGISGIISNRAKKQS